MLFTAGKPILNSGFGAAPADLAEKGRLLLQTGQYTEAYLLLYHAAQEKTADASVYFNLGLCLLFAGEGEKALACLDSGFGGLKHGGMGRELTADRDVLASITKAEAAADSYKAPMHSMEPELFPRQCRDRFLRLIVDACLVVGDHGRIHQIGDMLGHKQYANVLMALRKIETG